MKKTFLFLFLLFCNTAYSATTFYIRDDGGTGVQCTGKTNAAYPGSGNGQACAYNHPMWSFPESAQNASYAASPGDTVVIVKGTFHIGCLNPSTCADPTYNYVSRSNCDALYPYGCYLGAIPDNVTVIGCSITGCGNSAKPILWGSNRINAVLMAYNHSNVTIQDLEITDHEATGQNNNSYFCNNDVSSNCALNGIYVNGATNLTLKNLYIHGIGGRGVFGGSVNGLTFDNVNIDKNGFGGYESDSCGSSACGNTGNIIFQNHTKITYSGCIESYPPTNGQANLRGGIVQCYDQNYSGNGDGVAANRNDANWYAFDSEFSHNASDGFDLLYHNSNGVVKFIRSKAEGNVGQAFKGGGLTNIVENSIIIGNCDYWSYAGITRAPGFTQCRANGSALTFNLQKGVNIQIKNSSIWSDGAIAIEGGSSQGTSTPSQFYCDGTESFVVQNSSIFGVQSATGNGQNARFYYCDGDFNGDNGTPQCCTGDVNPHPVNPSSTYSNFWQNQDGTQAGTGNLAVNPHITQGDSFSHSPDTDSFDFSLTSSSTSLIGTASTSVTFDQGSNDYNHFNRGLAWDMGALEFGSGPTPVVCGNNTVETGETCDGTDLQGQSCTTYGFQTGTLACSANCLSFDQSGCYNFTSGAMKNCSIKNGTIKK